MPTNRETKQGIIGYEAKCGAPFCGWRSQTKNSEALAKAELNLHQTLAHEVAGTIPGNVYPIFKEEDDPDRGAGQ